MSASLQRTHALQQNLWLFGRSHRPVALGSRTVNSEPLPASLATVMSPPIMRASLRVMARPRPVPPNFRASPPG
jgi:hypothetical protein